MPHSKLWGLFFFPVWCLTTTIKIKPISPWIMSIFLLSVHGGRYVTCFWHNRKFRVQLFGWAITVISSCYFSWWFYQCLPGVEGVFRLQLITKSLGKPNWWGWSSPSGTQTFHQHLLSCHCLVLFFLSFFPSVLLLFEATFKLCLVKLSSLTSCDVTLTFQIILRSVELVPSGTCMEFWAHLVFAEWSRY